MSDKVVKFLENIVDNYKVEKITEDSLNFLELSGRQAAFSQGNYGEGEIIAVIDTGVAQHEEFEDRLLPGKNFLDYGSEYGNFDDNSHGTHIAGSIAGKITGVRPKAEILPLKVINQKGSGNWKTIIESFKYIRNWSHPKTGKKVDVVSISFSSGESGISTSRKEELHSIIKQLHRLGIIVVCSAGNTSKEEIRYPAYFDEVVCVGAVDILKNEAKFSTKGMHIDVCQTGVNVLSAFFEGGYASKSGTSMATPIVAGIVSAIKSKYIKGTNEDIDVDSLKKLLYYNTKDLGLTGPDKTYGVGFATLQPLNMHLKFKVDSLDIVANNITYKMDTTTLLHDKRVKIPVRFMGENTGACFIWNNEDKIAELIW